MDRLHSCHCFGIEYQRGEQATSLVLNCNIGWTVVVSWSIGLKSDFESVKLRNSTDR